MRRTLLLWLLWLLARSACHSPVQRYFQARRTRSHSAPLAAGVYTRLDHALATQPSLRNVPVNAEISTTEAVAANLFDIANEPPGVVDSEPAATSPSAVEHAPWPARGRAADTLNLAASDMMKSFQSMFRTDDEDIRNGFKNSYNVWPFFYQNMYPYEPKETDADVEKAKDKRSSQFAVAAPDKVIPVHELVDEPPEHARVDNVTTSALVVERRTDEELTTDNPNFGNQPFFSYVLNDYFDKNDDEDSATYKTLPWGSEFDHEMALQDIDDYVMRARRLEETPRPDRRVGSDSTEARDSRRESASRASGDDGSRRYAGEHYSGFKDFVDSFANRYGSEDHDRSSNYAKTNNADKGGKKKGFRKVYHKDEYQELHDFFDNTGNSENVEEKGASKVRIGGSEGALRSLAGAAVAEPRARPEEPARPGGAGTRAPRGSSRDTMRR